MSTPTQARHAALVEQTARKYREDGFDVVPNPTGAAFGWRTAFEPDLVARRDDETVVIEVASRQSLRQRPGLRDLAREIDARPGWRLELVLSDELDETGEPPTVTRDVVRRWLEAIDHLGAAGQWEAAALLSASALEAALRHAAESRGVHVGLRSPRELLRLAASLGSITDEELVGLEDLWQARNALAHGLALPDQRASRVADVARRFAATASRVLDDASRE